MKSTLVLYRGAPPPGGHPLLTTTDPQLVELLWLGLHHQLQTVSNGLRRRTRRARRAA